MVKLEVMWPFEIAQSSNTGIIYFIINNITVFLHITGFVPKNCCNFVTAHNFIKKFGATGT